MKRLLAVLAVLAAALALPAGASAKRSGPTIVDTVIAVSGTNLDDGNSADYDILREAVVATGLAPALSGQKQYTVFAPNDAAFLKLGLAPTESGTVSALVGALGVDGVRQVLLYHVARGARGAEDVVPATRIKTLQGSFITKESGSTTLSDAVGRDVQIIAPFDLRLANGYIHTVDQVLLPFAP